MPQGKGRSPIATAWTQRARFRGGDLARQTLNFSDRSADGSTVWQEYLFEAGAAPGDANASGATLTAATLAAVGAPTGGATVAGATLAHTTSLLAGSATGSAAAAGVAVTTSESIAAGSATGAAVAGGAVLAPTAPLLVGSATGAAALAGVTLVAGTSLLAGAAAGDPVEPPPAEQPTSGGGGGGSGRWILELQEHASARGAQLEAQAQLLAAQAIATAMAPGVLLGSGARLLVGRARGESFTRARAEEDELTALLAAWL